MTGKSKKSRDYPALLADARTLAARTGWRERRIGAFDALGQTYEIFVFTHFGETAPSRSHPEFSVSAGMHGDEPAGPAAALALLEKMPAWPEIDGHGVSLIVCENPTGYEADTRENWNGVDLNRDWRSEQPQPETGILRPYFASHPFGLTIELHEDVDTHGFYLYERIIEDPDAPAFGPEIIKAMIEAGLPVNFDMMIDGHPASGGIIYPKAVPSEMPLWPKAIFNHVTHARHTLTFESAPPLALETRVRMQEIAVRTALQMYLDSVE